MGKTLVNPVAIQNCFLKMGDFKYNVSDLSFERIIVEANETESLLDTEEVCAALLKLDRTEVQVGVRFQNSLNGCLRFRIEKLLPSQMAHLRSFLSAKKIGESLLMDGQQQALRHYHGLNESEIFFDGDNILFSYMDPSNLGSQFYIKVKGLQVSFGSIPRPEYVALESLEAQWPESQFSDREAYSRLGECRDILTNFRPTTSQDFTLKQKFLKILSDTLYSAGRRVEALKSRTVYPISTASPPHKPL